MKRKIYLLFHNTLPFGFHNLLVKSSFCQRMSSWFLYYRPLFREIKKKWKLLSIFMNTTPKKKIYCSCIKINVQIWLLLLEKVWIFFWGFIEFFKNNFVFLRKFVGSIFNKMNRTYFTIWCSFFRSNTERTVNKHMYVYITICKESLCF